MFHALELFSGFSVLDLNKTREFYSDVLGLNVEQNPMGVVLHLPNGADVFLYQKDTHQPATFTVLNLRVENIDQSLEALQNKGVKFIHYDSKDIPQDEKGIVRGIAADMGPDIAWFEDPSKNILSILQEK